MCCLRSGAAAAAIVMLGAAAEPPLAQTPRSPTRLSRAERTEAQELVRLVEAVAGGALPGGDAWLGWHSHFFRTPDGRTYVPFTITIEEARDAFRSVGIYVRAARRQSEGRDLPARGIIGLRPGEIPVYVPERQFAPDGAPVPGENSAALRLAFRHQPETKPSFEEVGFVDVVPSEPGRPPRLQRALVVPPGEYDIYVALRERPSAEPDTPRWTVLKRPLVVPDFTTPGLAMSSIVLLDRLEPLDGPLSKAEQAERPYALGAIELVPAPDASLSRDEVLSVAFLIYDAAMDPQQKPDVSVEYQFHEQTGLGERFFRATEPQVFDAGTLPADFDLRKAGHQIAAIQSVPLSEFGSGRYRLAITVTDQLGGAATSGEVLFTVR